MEERMTVKEVQAFLMKHGVDISQRAITRWCNVNTVDAVKIGRSWFILKSSVTGLMDQARE